MNFEIHKSLKTEFPETTVMPLVKGVNFEKDLKTAATITGLDYDWLARHFKGDTKEILPLFIPAKNKTFYLLGLGEQACFASLLKNLRYFVFQQKTKLPAELGVYLLHFADDKNYTELAEGCANGIKLGRYQIGYLKSEKSESCAFENKKALVHFYSPPSAEQAIKTGFATAATQMEIFDLVNSPSNKKTPEYLGAWAKASGKKYKYSVEVFDKNKIEKTGLHALLAVNRGSAQEPVFIVMEYKPPKSAGKKVPKIGLVGKGVTFDTGGISIKPSTNMHYMKSDMGGAAAVLGAMELTAKLQLPIHLVAAIPSTENSVDANSINPGDVIQSYSGKTIEVIDTDAEGRLILADGLNYIVKNYAPDILIDLATLTGSAVRTFGYHAGALFSNNDDLTRQLLQTGEGTGERLWQLPLWDAYKDDIKSDIADIRNFSGKPTAGAISAAKFLEAFIENHPRWAHMDIAGVSFVDSEFATQKSASGFGIKLLTEFFKSL